MDKSIIQTLRSTRPMSWKTFKTDIPKIQAKLNEPLFRGQGNQYLPIGSISQVGWRLESSLYRRPDGILGSSNPSFINWLKNIFNSDVKKEIKAIVKEDPLDIKNPVHIERIMAVLQHIGFATPMLDWTPDPFIAVYFAFHNICSTTKEVTIFLFDQHAWENNPNFLPTRDHGRVKIKRPRPDLPRQVAQKSVYTYFRGGIDIYSQILSDGPFITYWYLSIDEKDVILSDLKERGITQESLFPDESDKTIASLKERLEPLYKEYCSIKNQQYKRRCGLVSDFAMCGSPK